MLRDGIRPRQIDEAKRMKVIADLSSEIQKCTEEEKAHYQNIETQLKYVIDNFSKIKKIVTPNYQEIKKKNKSTTDANAQKLPQNPNADNAKASSKTNSTTTSTTSNNNQNNNNFSNHELVNINNNANKNINNNSDDILDFQLQEFERPEHLIIYSQKQREEREKKGYEAKSSDYMFMKFYNEFINNVEDLEKIFTAFEDEMARQEKIEKIDEELGKKIIADMFPKYSEHASKIINHYNSMRDTSKKALMRKYWRVQKFTDKHLSATFRKREREKMKTRKNNQNKQESLGKIKKEKELCKTDINNILISMCFKENLKQIQNIFNQQSFYIENGIPLEHEHKQKNEISSTIQRITSYIKTMDIKPPQIRPPVNPQPPVHEPKPDFSQVRQNKIPIKTEKRRENTSFKSILTKFKDKTFEAPNSEDKNDRITLRVRFSRLHKRVIDRYIQKDGGHDVFDDDFNKQIFNYGKAIVVNNQNNYLELDEDYSYSCEKSNSLVLRDAGNENFDSLYHKFKSHFTNFNMLFDGDNDDLSQGELKSFGSLYKSFLKQKRGHL